MDIANSLYYIADFHVGGERQGPGSDASTLRALAMLPPLGESSTVLDLGCGTGAQTLTLLRNTPAQVFALDILPVFLDRLSERARAEGYERRLRLLDLSMDNLPFAPESFDVLWSEGAIYNIGFAEGLRYWRDFLKPGGYAVVSELTWLTDERPQEVADFWSFYTGMGALGENLTTARGLGYEVTGHFVLPATDWTDNYYAPMLARSEAFLAKHNSCEPAVALVEEGKLEAEVYNAYSDYYGYVFYILRRTD